MLNSDLLKKFSNNLNEIILNSPAKDLEKNFDALLRGMFSKMALVSREEFDIQAQVLKTTREKLEVCEKKLQEIESALQKNNT